GVAVDHNFAVTAFATACDGGDGRSCFKQGRLLLDGQLQKQPAPGWGAIQKSCDSGVAAGCRYLAERAAKGDGVAREPVVAATLFRRACVDGDLRACVSGGLLYRDGDDDLPRNGDKAVFLFELGCDAGLPTACGYLGEILLKGWGVPVDTERGQELVERACRDGDFGACRTD
ncbi:MAG: tetratricopeptide repeat protein, partial [Myxococcota bacterium]